MAAPADARFVPLDIVLAPGLVLRSQPAGGYELVNNLVGPPRHIGDRGPPAPRLEITEFQAGFLRARAERPE